MGGKFKKEGTYCIHVADLCWCIAENSTILWSNYPPMKNLKRKKLRESQPNEGAEKAKSISSRGTVCINTQSLNPWHFHSVYHSFWVPGTCTIREEWWTLRMKTSLERFQKNVWNCLRSIDFIPRSVETAERWSSAARISSVVKRVDKRWAEGHPFEGYYVTLALVKDDTGLG